jgi:NAD(P)-dependent dehydrogenase (short-subunit alcohol dehydrogenase family)
MDTAPPRFGRPADELMALGPSAALLTDRVAVVTGAAEGIGEGIARTFAQFGAQLALCDRKSEELTTVASAIQADGSRVLAQTFDVREAARVAEFFGAVGQELGRIDVLVNNVGGGFEAPLMDVSAKGEDALVRENFSTVTSCARAAVPLFPEAGGVIINITSIEAHRAAPGYAIYAAMKAAVESLTKSLALEFGDRLIRVNCIAPDLIPTPGIGEVNADTPLSRRGCVDDVAGAAVFLASDLSRFVTGTTVHVDGGGLAAAGWRRTAAGGFSPG